MTCPLTSLSIWSLSFGIKSDLPYPPPKMFSWMVPFWICIYTEEGNDIFPITASLLSDAAAPPPYTFPATFPPQIYIFISPDIYVADRKSVFFDALNLPSPAPYMFSRFPEYTEISTFPRKVFALVLPMFPPTKFIAAIDVLRSRDVFTLYEIGSSLVLIISLAVLKSLVELTPVVALLSKCPAAKVPTLAESDIMIVGHSVSTLSLMISS